MRRFGLLGVLLFVMAAACGDGLEREGGTDPATLRWTQVPSYQLDAGRGIWMPAAISPGGPGLVAVGDKLTSAQGQNGVVWVSSDGMTWAEIPDDSGTFGGPGDQEMAAVVAGGPGLVAVGTAREDADLTAVVWVSADGYAWERVENDEAVFGGPGDQVMRSVTVASTGLVAVGTSWQGAESTAVVWVSADGYAWERVEHDEAVFGGVGHQVMSSVTAGGPGVVAVGYDDSGPDKDMAVWVSGDGYGWVRVKHDEANLGGPESQEAWQVVSGGPGLVAIGEEREAEGWVSGQERDAAVWVSVDGYEWLRIPNEGTVFGGPERQSIRSVVAVGGGVVAVGWDEVGDDAVIWRSSDGYVWDRVEHDEAVFGGPTPDADGVPPTPPTTMAGHPQLLEPSANLDLIALGGPGVIAYGHTEIGGAFINAAWTAALPVP